MGCEPCVITAIEKAEALLSEIEKVRPLAERGAWAIDHQRQMAECIRDLLAFHTGYAQETRLLAKLASRLLAACSRLLVPLRGSRGFIDEWREGTAPDLRAAAAALRDFMERNE